MGIEATRVTVDGSELPITIDLASGKIELTVDEHVAYIGFRVAGKRLSAMHTEVPVALRGKKIGDHLAHALLDYARREGMQVEPHCPFVAAYIKRHAQYADLVSPTFKG